MERSQNELELALESAAKDEAARPRFYEVLLQSQVLVVPAGDIPAHVGGVVQADAILSLPTTEINGTAYVPFYSSENRLSPGTAWLELSAVDLLNITRGAHLVLNHGSAYGKAFLPDEIASLLDGSMFKPAETFTAPAGQQQLIGQPKEYPHQFVAAVARYLASEPSVERAFLAQHFIAGVHTQPAILIALVALEEGFERIAGAVGVIAKDTRKAAGAVDVTRLKRGQLGYFENEAPIYERKKRGFFERLFG